MTSAASIVIPRVKVTTELPGIAVSYTIAFEVAAVAPLFRTNILATAEDKVVFAIAIVEVTD
jgi:hypothetical protein